MKFLYAAGQNARRERTFDYLLRAQEEQHERKQHQRLDKRESDEESRLDGGTCSWIASQGLSNGARDSALAEAGQAGCQAHAQANSDWNSPAGGRSCSSTLTLGVDRRRNHQHNYE